MIDSSRFWKGLGPGVVATVVMSMAMIAGVLSGLSPMPRPIPLALARKILGGGMPAVAWILAIGAHLLYGGLFGGLLAALTYPVTIAKGVLLGLVLWLVAQVLWLPVVGWGMFGSAVTPMIAEVTLVLHVIYGGTVGWLIDRQVPEGPDALLTWPERGSAFLRLRNKQS